MSNEKIRILRKVAKSGNIELLLVLIRDYKYPIDKTIFKAAVIGGHLNMLKVLKKMKCPFPSNICIVAAYYGHLQILDWLRVNQYDVGFE